MKNILHFRAAFLLFVSLFAFGSSAQAQEFKTQGKGKGALVYKSQYKECITGELTGLAQCVDMTQETYVVTPSGNETSVWKGTAPAALRPAKTLVKDATWQEAGKTYTTHSTTTPSGEVSVTLHYKANGKGGKGKG
ncbi:hypothetical protein E5K00_13040 [Hymenobacter aquaticus]|uniref:Lipocalin-like domain-containing protein n=1 Tax=Hymenobacter aquaticus TaxID=1867101 RepID=A0A4Z0PU27_9BACT|nr:hypothetical protein [Hymenobacter aquaticus]TGE21217.1 hypothetical protein E5K00_13040 [Hymenobacter aquaticus]